MTVATQVSEFAENVRWTTLRYLLAGNATFTVVYVHDVSTGGAGQSVRFTYRVYTPRTGKNAGKVVVQILTGPDNTGSYETIGTVEENGVMTPSGKFAINAGKVQVHAALVRWLIHQAQHNPDVIPDGLRVYGSGRCARCGKVLTDPTNEYFPYLGPICGGGGSD